jgi:hypothetical protein
MRKNQWLLYIYFILFSVHLHAQTYKKRSPEEKARFYTDEMVREINVTPEQEPQIFSINLEVSKQFDSLYATKPDKNTARLAAIEIYKKRDMAFRKVLTTKQFLLFDDLQRDKLEKRRKEKENKRLEDSIKHSMPLNQDSIKSN